MFLESGGPAAAAGPIPPTSLSEQLMHTSRGTFVPGDTSGGRGLRLPARGDNKPPLKGGSGRTTVRLPGRRNSNIQNGRVSNSSVCECSLQVAESPQKPTPGEEQARRCHPAPLREQ